MFYNFNYILHVYTLVTFTHLWNFRYDIYSSCVYIEKRLMMDRGTVWNM
jgi:hypothetical protein